MVELDSPHLNFAAMAEGHGCKSSYFVHCFRKYGICAHMISIKLLHTCVSDSSCGAGTVARTEAELAEQLQMALAQQEGPWLIEAVFNRGGASL